RFQPPGAFRLLIALEREACRRSSHSIFISQANWEWAKQLDVIQNGSASLIRMGVEVEPLLEAKRSDEFRAEFGIPRKSKVVGMIAARRAQKDPLTFVEAASMVTRKRRTAKFLLIGDGELAEAVAQRAGKLMTPENFIQAGWKRNIPEILANLNLLIVPSLWEGLPLIIPQATIAGVPV